MSHAYLWFLSTIAARTAIVLIFMVAGLRLLGKRQMGQMNLYDLALIMALSNAVQNAMTNGAGDLSVGIISAGTLLLIGRVAANLFVRAPKLSERLCGTPTVLIDNGEYIGSHMRRECVTEEEVMAVLRQHGIDDPKRVMMAILEVDGTISVVPKEATHSRKGKPPDAADSR
jgi:uncharacterized membrane protein YcaP (DUF421 family)